MLKHTKERVEQLAYHAFHWVMQKTLELRGYPVSFSSGRPGFAPGGGKFMTQHRTRGTTDGTISLINSSRTLLKRRRNQRALRRG